MKSKSFMEEVEEYCELLLKCAKNNKPSKELTEKYNRILKLYKKRTRKSQLCTTIISSNNELNKKEV